MNNHEQAAAAYIEAANDTIEFAERHLENLKAEVERQEAFLTRVAVGEVVQNAAHQNGAPCGPVEYEVLREARA